MFTTLDHLGDHTAAHAVNKLPALNRMQFHSRKRVDKGVRSEGLQPKRKGEKSGLGFSHSRSHLTCCNNSSQTILSRRRPRPSSRRQHRRWRIAPTASVLALLKVSGASTDSRQLSLLRPTVKRG